MDLQEILCDFEIFQQTMISNGWQSSEKEKDVDVSVCTCVSSIGMGPALEGESLKKVMRVVTKRCAVQQDCFIVEGSEIDDDVEV